MKMTTVTIRTLETHDVVAQSTTIAEAARLAGYPDEPEQSLVAQLYEDGLEMIFERDGARAVIRSTLGQSWDPWTGEFLVGGQVEYLGHYRGTVVAVDNNLPRASDRALDEGYDRSLCYWIVADWAAIDREMRDDD